MGKNGVLELKFPIVRTYLALESSQWEKKSSRWRIYFRQRHTRVSL